MVKVLEERLGEIVEKDIDLEKSKVYEIDLGKKGFITAKDILVMKPEYQSDECCYSGGSCYSNCDID